MSSAFSVESNAFGFLFYIECHIWFDILFYTTPGEMFLDILSTDLNNENT